MKDTGLSGFKNPFDEDDEEDATGVEKNKPPKAQPASELQLPSDMSETLAAPSPIPVRSSASDEASALKTETAPPDNDAQKSEQTTPSLSFDTIDQVDLPSDDKIENDPPQRGMMGEKLIASGALTTDQLHVALLEKQKSGKMLGEVLVDLGFVTSDALTHLLAESSGYEEFDPSVAMLDPDALALMPKELATKYQVLAVSLNEKTAVVAMADPYDVVALDKLRQIFPNHIRIEPQLCSPSILLETIDHAYGYASSVDGIIKELAGEGVAAAAFEELTEDTGYSHPIVRLVNALVFDAVKIGASDVHIEPEEGFIRVRYRLDGILRPEHTIHGEYWSGIAQRLKIMSGMNIAEKMRPQDGRFNLTIGGKEADFRVSSLPTIHGENFVLRILDKEAGIMPMAALGFSAHNLELIRRAQAKPEGIIIVTGPTGSGKTTSLYSMINEINTVDVNIMTLEDPVEFSMSMIRQTNVREGAGLTFGDGVKALLRQDPDIIFIGEVRDKVTGEQALKAAMTGHQVYTTLHTNDSFGAIPRLLDLGLKPGMLAGSIVACFAQRLTRRLCVGCKIKKTATTEECRILGIDAHNPPQIYEANPKGCEICDHLGFKGRVAIVEILFMDEDLNDIIAADGHKSELKKAARAKGFKSMADDGVEKILEGLTSIAAVARVVSLE